MPPSDSRPTTLPEGSAASTSDDGWIVLHLMSHGVSVAKMRIGRVEALELIRDLSSSLEEVLCG